MADNPLAMQAPINTSKRESNGKKLKHLTYKLKLITSEEAP